jgi:hypothetical protein
MSGKTRIREGLDPNRVAAQVAGLSRELEKIRPELGSDKRPE